MASRSPPFQLVPGDRYNLTLGVLAAFFLGTTKDLDWLPPFVRWQANAYTNWNLFFILLGRLTNQRQWEPFLLVNSIGISLGFRTAFCQGLDDNMRKKIKGLGLDLPRNAFIVADHLCHTAPPVMLLASLLSRGQRVHPMNSVYALVLATWFSFRQSAQLDSSGVYVPHPWKRAWIAIAVGVLATPRLVNSLLSRQHARACEHSRLGRADAELQPHRSRRRDDRPIG